MLDNQSITIAEGSAPPAISKQTAATIKAKTLQSNNQGVVNHRNHSFTVEEAGMRQQQNTQSVFPKDSPVNVLVINKESLSQPNEDDPVIQQQSPETIATATLTDDQDQTPLTPPSSPETPTITRASRSNLDNKYQQSNSSHFEKKTCSTYEYNNRILAAKRSGNIRAVMNEFVSMKRHSVHMTQHTYNLVLEAHANLRREGTPLNTMLKIYNEMIQSGIQPNAYTYALMIRSLCKRDVEVQKTVAMLRRQSARIGQDNEDIQLLEAEGNVTKALAMFHYAVADNASVKTFDIEIFNQLLRVLSHYGDAADATFVYNQLEQPYVRAKPNSATYAALINLFGRAGDIDTALHYYDIYTRVKRTLGPHDTSYIYNALVDCHLKCGLLENALHVVEHDMVEHQVKLTSIPYNSIIRHYCANGQMKEAEALIDRLVDGHRVSPERYPEPDASSYGPLLASYCQQDKWEDASRIYQALKKTDISKAYGNLANYALLCLAHGARDRALSVVIDDMKNANLEPDPVLAGRIIASFSRANDVLMAVDAISTVQKAISARNLTKGAHHLLDGALEVVLHCSSVHQVLKVAHAVQPLITIIYDGCTAQKSHPRQHHLSQHVVESRTDRSSYLTMYKILIDSYFDHALRVTKESQDAKYSVLDFELLLRAALNLYDHNETYSRSQDLLPTSMNNVLLKILSDAQRHNYTLSDSIYTQVHDQLQRHGDAETLFRWKTAFFKDKEEPVLSRCGNVAERTTSSDDVQDIDSVTGSEYEDANTDVDDELIIQIAEEESDELLATDNDHSSKNMKRTAQIAPLCSASSISNDDDVAESTTIARAATNKILKAVVGRDYAKAIHIFENKIICRGLIPDPEIMRDVIALAGKQGDLQTALTIYNNAIYSFKDIPDATVRDHAIYMVTNSILIGYAQAGDMAKAKVFYDRIKAMAHFPDSNGYASMLLGSAKSATSTDEATDALVLYDEAKRHNVKPTTFFYNVIISKLAKARKLDVALTLFEEMRLFQIPANSITYGAIISASVRSGSETHSRRLFVEMLSSPSSQPRVGPFNNMMQFYVRQKPNRERVLEYFAELRRRHIKPSPHSYKLLMEAYTHIAPYDMPMAHKLLSDMVRRDGLRPQTSHYTTLIYSYGILQRDIRSAERVYSEMKKAGISPDEGVYQALIDTFISNDALEKAEHMYSAEVSQQHRHGSPYIENLFIRGYGEKGNLAKAEAIFDAMSDDKTQYDKYIIREPSTYEALIRAYLENGVTDKARQTLSKMVKRDFPPRVVGAVADLLAEE